MTALVAVHRTRTSPPTHAISSRLVVSRSSATPVAWLRFIAIDVRLLLWKTLPARASERGGRFGVFMALSLSAPAWKHQQDRRRRIPPACTAWARLQPTEN